MQYSGYGKRFRYDVVKSALNAYRKLCEKDQQGERPMYRQKDWRRLEREKEKREKKRTWYKKGGYDSVVFVPGTPRSELRKILEEDVKNSGIKIKVVETSGSSMKKLLQRSDPFSEERCKKEDCMVCGSDGRGKCKTQGVTYEIQCTSCNDKYIGETARSAYARGKEHMKAMHSDNTPSVLFEHCRNKHNSVLQDFSMSVTGVFPQDPMGRQITESVLIKHCNRNKLMNTKQEWNHVKIPRMKIEDD